MKAVVALIVLAALGLFGWHLRFQEEAVERVEKIPGIALVDRAVPVKVRINPFTNRVEVSLAVAMAAEPENLVTKLAAAMGSALVAEAWPQAVESELAHHARERNDFYAMIVPYRAFVVQPPAGSRTPKRDAESGGGKR